MDFLSPEQILRDVETVGPKARRLAEARTRGFPVPPFVVLRPNAGADAPWGADGRTRLADALQSLNAPSYAVRSCAVEEDGVASHAGRFLTRLAVAPGDVPAAVEAVWADARARGAAAGFAVMLQRQVAAERAGVVFTRHPLASPHFLIEWVEGPGAPLVGGTAAPRRASFLRGAAPADGPLSRAALRWVLAAEELFGHPQDVEWAMEKGAFFFLQSRPITALSAEAARGLQRIEADLPAGDFLYEKNELTEAAPRPAPVTWEILRRLYGPDGPVARAYRGVGVSYRDTGCLVSVGGELYIDRDREWDGFFPALAPRSGSAIRWRSWRGAGRTLWNALRLAFFAPGDGRAAIAALRASLAAPSPGNAAAALARLLTDYELVFDVNLRSARALAAAEKKLGRSLSAGEWRAGPPVEFPVPTGVEGNSLEITDTAPFRAAPSRPTGGDGRVPAVARTAAMWARLREASRWLTVKNVSALRRALREDAARRGWREPDLAFFGSLAGDVPEDVCRARRDERRAAAGFSGPARLSPDVRDTTGTGRGVSAGTAVGVLVGVDGAAGDEPIFWLDDLSIERAPLLDRARGILADRGGTLSHLAILAREKGIPVVVDPGARRRFRCGDRARLDGTAGRVESLSSRPA